MQAFFVLSDKYYCRTYIENGFGSLTDSTLAFVWQLIQEAGYEHIIFYDRDYKWSVPEFVQWAKSDDKIFYVLFKTDGTPIACTWFNGFSDTGHQAYSHFTTLKLATPEECMEAGRLVLKLVSQITLIDQFIGMTPMCYHHALRYSEGLGFKHLTVLKKHAMLRGKERDVRLSICEPGEE